jgi:hypothetical protein
MIITKRISTSINVNDCIGIYVDSDNILQYIVNKFQGRCYDGCFIKTVKRIVRMGECEINKDGFPDFGVLSITFDVEAVVYAVGEIINGCVVKNRDPNGILVCGTDIAHIMIAPNKLLDSINRDQYVSIRVGKVKYSIGVDKISICAMPYLPTSESIIYKMGPISNSARGLLSGVMSRITAEETEMGILISTNAVAWNTFNQLLYAYKEPQTAPDNATIVNIKELVNKGKTSIGYLSRDSKIDLALPNAYAYDADATFGEGVNVVSNFPPQVVLLILLEDYCAYLRTIREFISIYSDSGLLISHTNLWKIYKKVKS